MIHTTRVLLLILITSMVILNGCKDDEGTEDSNLERRTQLITKTWTVLSVTVPQGSATLPGDWANFTVTFTATNMTTAGHADGSTVVWPSGTWSFTNENANIIQRQDGVEMTVSSLSESGLSVSFTLPEGTEITGRTASLEGQYIFNLQ